MENSDSSGNIYYLENEFKNIDMKDEAKFGSKRIDPENAALVLRQNRRERQKIEKEKI